MGDDCVFCKIVKGEIKADIVEDNSKNNFIVFNDANPVAEGHCLIVSKKHYDNVFELPSSLGVELLDIVKKQGMRLIKGGKADGIKVVNNNGDASGQLIKHFHYHVIPEKNNVKRENGV